MPYVVHPAFDPSGLGPWGNESRSASRAASEFEGRATNGMDNTNFSRVDSDVSKRPKLDASGGSVAVNEELEVAATASQDLQGAPAADPQVTCCPTVTAPQDTCPASVCISLVTSVKERRCALPAVLQRLLPRLLPAPSVMRAYTRLVLLCQDNALQAMGAIGVLGGAPLQLGKAH